MVKNVKNALFALLLSGFILGIHGGNLALLDGETGKAIEVFPLRACLLPPADQESLAKGIRVGSRDALERLLEDYLS